MLTFQVDSLMHKLPPARLRSGGEQIRGEEQGGISLTMEMS